MVCVCGSESDDLSVGVMLVGHLELVAIGAGSLTASAFLTQKKDIFMHITYTHLCITYIHGYS